MREIKFRAWHAQAKKMYPVTALDMEGGQVSAIAVKVHEAEGIVYSSVCPSEHLLLMQYTGRNDASGREIYEGDILTYTYSYPKNKPFVVEFDVQEFADGDYEAYCIGYNLDPSATQHYEVIGNIYEHPDLLREAQA